MTTGEGMNISDEQASAALADITRVARRAAVSQGYRRGAPHLFLWAAVWFVGYGVSYLAPARAGMAWLALDIVGIGGSYWISRGSAQEAARGTAQHARRFATLGASILLFLVSTYLILPPTTTEQLGAFPPLLVAFGYAIIGTWAGPRWLACAAVLFAATLGGHFLLRAWFMPWMGLAGASILCVSGLWLRRG
ncbi:MAG TPA: hypothetical protein VMH77_08855 [Steroidobacteraceae bacterium]|nr:hypothetical protein [Steroidobacteraceae bacterium]